MSFLLNSMQNISFLETHDFSAADLESLFLSVEWSSGHYPEKLVTAMRGFSTVFSAWDGDLLVGMICAMDDTVMNAYVHYLLVRPEYQHQGLGKQLVEKVKDKYKDFMRVVVVAYDKEIDFYEHCGFAKATDASPMFITELWT